MKNNKQYAKSTRTNYIGSLENMPSKLNINIKKPLLEITDVEELQQIVKPILTSSNYVGMNKQDHNVFSSAIEAYGSYLSSKFKFTWLPFYQELLDTIITKYNKETLGTAFKHIYSALSESTDYILEEIDPFSFIFNFNRYTKEFKRLQFLYQIKEEMGMKTEIKDVKGIPSGYSGFYWFQDQNDPKAQKEQIEKLWQIAASFSQNKFSTEDIQYILGINNIKLAKLSTVMFMCYPDKFFPLDTKTLDYAGQKLKENSAVQFNNMQEILKKQFPNKEPYEVSYEAWKESKKGDDEMDSMNVNVSSNTLAEDLAELLKNTKNIILHGAPGTGKTTLAQQIAEAMAAKQEFVQFHPSYDYTDFVEGLRPTDETKDNEQIGFKRLDGIFKKFCAQAIDNLEESAKDEKTLQKEEEIKEAIKSFVEQSIEEEKEFNTLSNRFSIVGITDIHIIVSVPDNNKTKEYRLPINNLCKMFLWDNQNNLQRKDLKDIFNHKYSNALDSYLFSIYEQMKKMNIVPAKTTQPILVKEKAHVFIIDEINRGDLSKIFGELFYAIEPSRRGERVRTQYQNLITDENDPFYEGFYIPQNVYIIGTMNDIDRSVESMDFAFRRRFTFVEITADKTADSILGNLSSEERETCKKIMEALNAKISNISGLGSPTDYHIGGSYFLKLEDLNYKYKKLWEYHLKGLLKEYFRGMEDAGTLLTDIEKEYNELTDKHDQ